ncbi:MAG: MFS transporter [Jatrophihabitantaceae bacterium]
MRQLLADRSTRLYLIGTTASSIGDNALWLTLLIWVKVLTGSTSQAGISIFMLTLGTMTGPLTGIIVDRVKRRPLLILTNLLTTLAVSLLLLVNSGRDVWIIDAVMFCYGVAIGIVASAQAGLLKSIVADELLGTTNATVQTIAQGSRLITPLICAGLYSAFGARPVILADLATFVLAIGCLLALRVSEPDPVPSGEHWLRDITAGARHLFRTVSLRQVAISAMLATIAFGLSETVALSVVTTGLHRPANFLGVLTSGQGLGAILSGLAAARLIRQFGEGLLIAAGLAAAALSFVLMVPSDLASVLVGFVLIGCSITWVVVGTATMLQRRTPSELVGRANSALGFLVTTPQTLAIALGAALVAVLDYRVILAVMAALLIVATGYLCTRPEQRRAEVAVREPAAQPH